MGGKGVSHYKSTRDGPEDNLALQKNDDALQRLIKAAGAPNGKHKHLILAMGFNYKPVRNPKRSNCHGTAFVPSTPHLEVHQEVIAEFEKLGFKVQTMNTYNNQKGGYNGNLAMDTYNKLAADDRNFVACVAHTTC